ncbi:right-handed parallel beta-helix repeat-containing protein [Rhodobacteraceae bacterium]|nr:right-handed parallel beta-helix repeat-containing protein [Paracoccaceae bacterium]
MNVAITQGWDLTPPAFTQGLGQWSSGNGTAGSATYAGAANAAIVTSDADFGGCLELLKTTGTQKLRWMGQTPILPGVYLRITARIKAVSGNLPSVRIAGYAMDGNSHVGGLTETGPSVSLNAYGSVMSVSAIVGTGRRQGVDMAWGMAPDYGHFGLDLTGQTGGVVRIDDLQIEDVSTAFLRGSLDLVDVRDYGALGDGQANDIAAFQAADQAAQGRTVIVPQGEYYLPSSVSFSSPMRFIGTVKMPTSARLALLSSFDFPTYAAAFGDETLGLKKALQALFGYTDHNILDLRGRRVELTEPLRVDDYAPGLTSFSNRRVIQNGQINVIGSSAWQDVKVTSSARFNVNRPDELSDVANVANIPVGARITGVGVGREVYVKAKNVGAQKVTLSQPMYGGTATRNFTFTRHQYIFDFSGMDKLDRFNIANLELLCNGHASGLMLAPDGQMNQIRDSYVNSPKDRGITSIGRGCQDFLIDGCQFLSNEQSVAAQDRTTIVLNANANDVKIRDSRFVRFATTFVLNGSGHLIVGNHWFQGDNNPKTNPTPGLVFTQTNVQAAVTGNYIDNNIIEWTNEHDARPNFGSEYSFGGLTVTGNTCVALNVAPWFRWFSIKPYGSGHFIQGLNISNNVFKALNGTVDQIEQVDTSFADLDYGRMRNVLIEGNTFNGITKFTASPVVLELNQSTAQATWVLDAGDYLPFGGWARNVESITAEGMVRDQSSERVTAMPYALVEQGARKQEVRLNWPTPAKGRVQVRLRMDAPT